MSPAVWPTGDRRSGTLYVAPRNVVLLALFAFLLGAWFTLEGGGSVKRRDVTPLVEGFRADLVTRISLERTDPAAVETGGVERTTLVRSGGELASQPTWSIEQLYGAAALKDRVDRLLSRLGSMTTIDLVTDDPARHGEYRLLREEALRLRLTQGEKGGESAEVEILLAAAKNRATWVRLAGDDRVWRIARYSPPSPAPRSWLDDTSLMSLQDYAIAGVEASGEALGEALRGETFALALRRGGEQRYVDSQGRDLPTAAVQDLLARMRNLFPLAVLEAKEAGEPIAGTPWLSLKVTPLVQGGAETILIDFAAPTEEPAVRCARRDSGTVVSVARSNVETVSESLRNLATADEKD